MSAVFLDPDQMDATANAITAHAAEVEAAARDLEGVGAGTVPPALAGWLESELADIATTVRVTAVLYLVAAMDTIMRAEAMRTNQSLATAFPNLGTVTPAFADMPLVGGLVLGQAQPVDASYTSVASGNGFVLSGSPAVDTSVTGGSLVGGFMLGLPGPNTPLGGYTPSFGGVTGLSGVGDSGHHNRLWTLSGEGRTYVSPNVYRGNGQTGDWHWVRPDPEYV